jgi:hypothetical protein
LASRITILEYELKRTKSEYDVALSEFNSEIGVRLQLQNAAALMILIHCKLKMQS